MDPARVAPREEVRDPGGSAVVGDGDGAWHAADGDRVDDGRHVRVHDVNDALGLIAHQEPPVAADRRHAEGRRPHRELRRHRARGALDHPHLRRVLADDVDVGVAGGEGEGAGMRAHRDLLGRPARGVDDGDAVRVGADHPELAAIRGEGQGVAVGGRRRRRRCEHGDLEPVHPARRSVAHGQAHAVEARRAVGVGVRHRRRRRSVAEVPGVAQRRGPVVRIDGRAPVEGHRLADQRLEGRGARARHRGEVRLGRRGCRGGDPDEGEQEDRRRSKRSHSTTIARRDGERAAVRFLGDCVGRVSPRARVGHRLRLPGRRARGALRRSEDGPPRAARDRSRSGGRRRRGAVGRACGPGGGLPGRGEDLRDDHAPGGRAHRRPATRGRHRRPRAHGPGAGGGPDGGHGADDARLSQHDLRGSRRARLRRRDLRTGDVHRRDLRHLSTRRVRIHRRLRRDSGVCDRAL